MKTIAFKIIILEYAGVRNQPQTTEIVVIRSSPQPAGNPKIIFLKPIYHYSEDLMVQPRIARMTRIMVCVFVQIRVIRGCYTLDLLQKWKLLH